MHDPTATVRGRGRTGARAALLAALLLPCGCTLLNPRIDPVERGRLERRAQDLLIRAARSDLDLLRCNAIEALADVAPEQGVVEFREALAAEQPLVRFAGCVAVGTVRDRGALVGVQRCRSDPDERVRLGAAFAAVRLGEPNAARVLAETLDSGLDARLRADAAYLIGKLGDRRALKRLERALRLEKSHRVLVHVHAAMALLGDEKAVESLAVYSHVDAESRVIALQSLAELGHARARDALLYRLRSREEFLETRLIAARGLGALGSREGYDLAAQHLFAAYNDEQDVNKTYRIRSLAAQALGAIGDERALPALQRLAESDADERTQVAACYAILRILRRP